MKSKLIFRILGALASALIIVSVFIPFVSVTGYTTSLWESFEVADSLYLPIMIIVFGAIGVVFFALNIKTEFAYMSTGAITFFLVIETIDILNQGMFDTLSLGYYFLAVGAILTGVMAFLTNLKPNKKNEKVVTVKQAEEPSMLDQIDKLYNDQSVAQTEISPIQPVNTVVEPILVQPLETVSPVVEQITPVVQEQPVEQVVQPIINEPINPVIPEQTNAVQIESQAIELPVEQPVNPVLQDLPVNPVVQEFSNEVSAPNPVVQEFSNTALQANEPINPVMLSQTFEQQPVPQVNQPVLPEMDEPISTNPVLQEFSNLGSTVVPQSNSNELDIFGQSINK